MPVAGPWDPLICKKRKFTASQFETDGAARIKEERYFAPKRAPTPRLEGSAPQTPAPGKTFSSGAEMLANRLRKNRRTLRRWARREGVDCFRLYDADLPEFALAVDVYQGDRMWVHVQEYQPPRRVDPAKATRVEP